VAVDTSLCGRDAWNSAPSGFSRDDRDVKCAGGGSLTSNAWFRQTLEGQVGRPQPQAGGSRGSTV
jgi:hypothetical protein